MGKDKKPLELNLTTKDICSLVSWLGTEIKSMKVWELLHVAEHSNFTIEFLLEVAKEEDRIDRKIIQTELQLMVEEAREEAEKGETLQ